MRQVYETSSGRFIIASEQRGAFYASVSRTYRRATGLSGATAGSVDVLARMGGVVTYATKQGAKRALKRELED